MERENKSVGECRKLKGVAIAGSDSASILATWHSAKRYIGRLHFTGSGGFCKSIRYYWRWTWQISFVKGGYVSIGLTPV